MSITFYPAGMVGHYEPHTCDDYCSALPCPGEWVDTGVNVSTTNARAILYALGLPAAEDLSGEIDPLDLKARIVLAQALDEDLATPSVTLSDPGMAKMTYCGRPAGYMQKRLERLMTVADDAILRGLDVHWA